jgi:hypothetical protein
MQLTDQQEEFSYAYIHAVATVADYGVIRSPRVVDNAGIDLTISALGDRNLPREPSLHVQVKCTYQDIRGENHLVYSLDAKTHHRLCREVSIPRLLVVVFVPDTPTHWLTHSEDELILRHCGYWLSLRGETPTSNQTGQTVYIPRIQRFDPVGLHGIMQRIDAEGQP